MADTHSIADKMRLLEPATKIGMKIDPMTLVSGNITYTWIYAGFLYICGGVKRQWGLSTTDFFLAI